MNDLFNGVADALLNGIADAALPLSDRGLHYGDGVFETLRWRHSSAQFLVEHYQRLGDGCRRLGFPAPSLAEIRHDCETLGRGRADAIIKVIVTRGNGGRGYRPPLVAQPNRIVSVHDLPAYPQQLWTTGILLTVCQTRISRNTATAGLKHLNRVEQVLAQAEFQLPLELVPDLPAQSATVYAHEGLMSDEHGNVIEGSMSNLHLVESGSIVTPRLTHSGVSGIIRAKIRQLAQNLEIPWAEADISLPRVFSADEVFVTNSVIGVWPVRQIILHRFRSIAMARRLQGELNRLLVESTGYEMG